jgi:hypothetical protein
MMGMVRQEGVFSGAALSAAILAVIQLLRAYGQQITPEQQEAWVGIVSSPLLEIAALMVGWVYARMNVYSRDSVAKLTGVEDPKVA